MYVSSLVCGDAKAAFLLPWCLAATGCNCVCSPVSLAPALRQAFQRLVYVSSLVFGDAKAAFLLPWRRHFNLTEAQLFVARRDNAKTIFRSMFDARGGNLMADRWG